jgi:hypothetical protein
MGDRDCLKDMQAEGWWQWDRWDKANSNRYSNLMPNLSAGTLGNLKKGEDKTTVAGKERQGILALGRGLDLGLNMGMGLSWVERKGDKKDKCS